MSASLRIDPGDYSDLIGRMAAFFAERDVPAWATGGYLRDAILGLHSHDIDVAVAGSPLILGPALTDVLGGHFFPLKEERGQARVLLTEPRVQIDLMPLRAPGLEEDLRLRDYTIDAMAVPLAELVSGEATLVDPTGGLDDLQKGAVRMTSEQALLDDALRLLRGPRIATELGFEIEPETAEAIRRLAPGVTSAAAERQRDEIIRIFATETAASGLRLLDSLGLFALVFPEIEPTRGAEQPKEHYHDVLGHSLAAVGVLDGLMSEVRPTESPQRELWDELWSRLEWCHGLREYFRADVVQGTTHRTLLKLCGLLHDIAKPQTRSFEANGRMRFFGHSEVGARMATDLLRRLRFSTRETEMIAAMIDAHLRPVQLGQQGLPTKRAIYRFFRDTGDAGVDTLFLSLADHVGTVGPRISWDGFQAHVALTSYILHIRFEDERVVAPKRLVDGDVLMAELGIGPGPLLGELLEAVREAHAAGEIDTPEEAVAFARDRLAASRVAGSQ